MVINTLLIASTLCSAMCVGETPVHRAKPRPSSRSSRLRFDVRCDQVDRPITGFPVVTCCQRLVWFCNETCATHSPCERMKTCHRLTHQHTDPLPHLCSRAVFHDDVTNQRCALFFFFFSRNMCFMSFCFLSATIQVWTETRQDRKTCLPRQIILLYVPKMKEYRGFLAPWLNLSLLSRPFAVLLWTRCSDCWLAF